MLMRLVFHWLILVVALYLITLMPLLGITYQEPKDLFWAAFALIIMNTIIRPILILFTLPLVLLSLGLFLLIINAIILYMLPHFVRGFHVPGFTSAFFGALLISLITGCFSGYEKRVVYRQRTDVAGSRSDKVIDI